MKSFATVSHFTESPIFVYNWFTEQVFISGFISVDHIIAHTDLVLTLFLFRIILVVTYAIFGVFLYLGATFSVYLLLRFIWHPCISLVISWFSLAINPILLHPFIILMIFGLLGISLIVVLIEPNLRFSLVLIKLTLRILVIILGVIQAVAVLTVGYVLNLLFAFLASSNLFWTKEINSTFLRLSNWPRTSFIWIIYLFDHKVIVCVLPLFKLICALRGHSGHLLLRLVFRCTRHGPWFRIIFILCLWLNSLHLQWVVGIVSRFERIHSLLHRTTFLSRWQLVRLFPISLFAQIIL